MALTEAWQETGQDEPVERGSYSEMGRNSHASLMIAQGDEEKERALLGMRSHPHSHSHLHSHHMGSNGHSESTCVRMYVCMIVMVVVRG